MHTAAEEFTLTLARASSRGSKYLRGLNAADREDAIATALAWCWEHRAAFDARETTLECWFANQLQTACRTIGRRNLKETVRRSYQTLEQLERVSPEKRGSKREEADRLVTGRAPIDHEIERMLQRPKHERADCPPCWRCMWYEGYTPRNYRARTFADKELQQAVADTERRKIEIAQTGDSRT